MCSKDVSLKDFFDEFQVFLQSKRIIRRVVSFRLTFDGRQDDAGVIVGDDVGVAVLGFVDLQVGMFPGELLARINGLWKKSRERNNPQGFSQTSRHHIRIQIQRRRWRNASA